MTGVNLIAKDSINANHYKYWKLIMPGWDEIRMIRRLAST